MTLHPHTATQIAHDRQREIRGNARRQSLIAQATAAHRPPRQAARAGRDADMLRQGAARTWEASPGTLSSLCRESFY